MRGELSAGIMRRLELSFYVESEGALRPAKVFENAYQVKQSKRGDLGHVVREYVTVGLRGRLPPQPARIPGAA